MQIKKLPKEASAEERVGHVIIECMKSRCQKGGYGTARLLARDMADLVGMDEAKKLFTQVGIPATYTIGKFQLDVFSNLEHC